MANLNNNQLQQLLDAARPQASKKVEPFSSGDPVDWSIWRANFELACTINDWQPVRARRELAASMAGQAKLWVRDIAIGDGAGALAVGGLLDAYEARFRPAAAGDLARVTLRDARQNDTEVVLAWHARARDLYCRAYPNQDAAAVEASQDLRDIFILGLADPAVRAKTWEARPATYAAALESATNFSAGALVLTQRQPQGVAAVKIKQEPGINAIHAVGQQPRDTSHLECFFCKRKGHVRRTCAMWNEARQFFLAGQGNRPGADRSFDSRRGRGHGGAPPARGGRGGPPPRGNNRGGFRGRQNDRGGRGRGSRQNSYNNSMRRVNCMDDASFDDDDVAEEDVQQATIAAMYDDEEEYQQHFADADDDDTYLYDYCVDASASGN
jgi:hypothetical protein